MSLKDYRRKRDFNQTPEPAGQEKPEGQGPLRYVVQLHQASRLHYDFRIEAGGVLKSWAVPKGITLDPSEQHLAVQVEDHPLSYGDFEGIIPKGNYGAGTVMVWDEGSYTERNSQGRTDSEKAILKGIEDRHITFLLVGKKLRGEFALIGLKGEDGKAWLLVKKRDSFASRKPIPNRDLSVKTGRTLKEIAAQAESKGEVWLSKRTDPQPSERDPVKPPPGQSVGKTSEKPEKIPRKVKPMLATPWPTPFEQKGWIFEIDRGGHRALAELESGRVHLYSRQFLPYENKYPEIVKSLRGHKIDAVVDGEIHDGVYWVRDLLHLNGVSLREQPLIERKRRLKELDIFDEQVRFSSHVTKCSSIRDKQGDTEGLAILARNAQSLYESGTSKQWLKIELHESDPRPEPRLTHLNKVLWPEEKITKGHLIDYYRSVAPALLPLLRDRPQSMHRHPDGIQAPGFFHKDLIEHHPRQVMTERIFSESSGKSINYLLCQNEFTLLYMINLGCIELNPWLSRVGSLDRPDAVVIDLDPDDSNSFAEVVEVATEIHRILDELEVPHYCKTSGATGLHIYLPTQAQYDYASARNFVLALCERIHLRFSKSTSLERSPSKRRGRIYLDCFQNAQGQTIAAPYSVRPRPGATVSTPLSWKEVNSRLDPKDFTIHSVPKRLEKLGNLWEPLLTERFDLPQADSRLRKKFPIRS